MITTARLILRAWRDADLAPFAALNADPAVMEHFPALLSREESDAFAARIRAAMAERGFGLWAAEVRGGAPFIGFIGLAVPRFDPPFGPCVEIGWRLARETWGQGYATEGARAALAVGFDQHGLDEIVSFTAASNLRSVAVMERLGMRRDGTFEHPLLPLDSTLREHVLYRLRRPAVRPADPAGNPI